MIAALPAALWFLCAFALHRRSNPTVGWALTLSGIPMLGLVTWQAGPLWGLLALAVALILLRTPFRTLRTRARRAFG
ncbi:DUF2484 family protein [Falsirhodobacter sp. 20TX0035]|uniref:DUF2484 family protein n=1 Tax=Falsirhodobacter sp. 20TX0035 TaxID=3022019 RepID=UPI00232BFCDC|nr:DUF2484 family protein [Falsirhodobacter sp. 20TX0035]MDB6452071.1 DUF2484 family protein [Falsirhodobacter sp. 20TX0035]